MKGTDIEKNIEEFKRAYMVQEKRRFQLMADETALEQRPRYNASTNEVVEMCREHAKGYDLTVEDWCNLEEIAGETAAIGSRGNGHWRCFVWP